MHAQHLYDAARGDLILAELVHRFFASLWRAGECLCCVQDASNQPCNHWNEQILIRPLVLLSRDVKALTDHSVIYVANLLKQSKDDVSRRGKWNILAEYLFHDIRIVSCRKN